MSFALIYSKKELTKQLEEAHQLSGVSSSSQLFFCFLNIFFVAF